MNGKIIAIADKRMKEADGFRIGQRVTLRIGGSAGTIIGFAPGWGARATALVDLDNRPGNMGTHHQCGTLWIEAEGSK